MHGETADVESTTMEPYIEHVRIKDTETLPHRNSYKCFCGEQHGLDYTKTILHATSNSAWHCLLIKMNYPKYAAILKLK